MDNLYNRYPPAARGILEAKRPARHFDVEARTGAGRFGKGGTMSGGVSKTAILLTTAALGLACSRPKPVEVTPRSVQVTTIQPQGLQLALVLDVHNPNGFAIRASDVKGTLTLQDGTELGRGVASDSVMVLSEQTAAVPTSLNMSWTNLAVLAPYALSPQPLPYEIHGSARIGSQHLNVELPFDIAGQLTREQVLQASLRGAGGLIPALPR
jgi:hypothetical protein